MKYILVNQSSKHAYKVAANDIEKNSPSAVEVTDELASQLESSTENNPACDELAVIGNMLFTNIIESGTST